MNTRTLCLNITVIVLFCPSRLTFAGESFVCDPDSEVLARAGAGTEETLICDLYLDRVATSHARTPFLRDRRSELYGDWLGPGDVV